MIHKLSSALILPMLLTAMPASAKAPGDTGASALTAQIQQANLALAQQRAQLRPAFDEAYRSYPNLPEGLLEAAAWAGSRWQHRIPEADFAGHHRMPQPYGVMGLHNGQAGYGDHVAAAARLLDVAPEAIINSPRLNILGGAALLDAFITEAGLGGAPIEALTPALRRFSGLPDGGAIARFAQDAFAFEVLSALDRGVDAHGVEVPEIAITFEDAFNNSTLSLLNAPTLRLEVDKDAVVPGPAPKIASADYPPAEWVASPNYSSRGGTAITHVTIHTVQGSYASCISWFQNSASQVSSHYVVRSSDGQVTQMVRESDKAWHVGSENPYTIGIEHEGFVDTPDYYTAALYDASAALTRDICSDNGIDCATAYDGPAHADVVTLSQSYHVKGHQHFPNQNHNDPGAFWDWAGYAQKVGGGDDPGPGGGWGDGFPGFPGGGGGGGMKIVLDDFETGEGHFDQAPAYSGSTLGISTASTAEQSSAQAHGGSYSEKLTLVDDASSSADWQVRFLSGSGSPASNTPFSTAKGSVGFWAYTSANGVTAGVMVDDSDGIELGLPRPIPQGRWTYLSWSVTRADDWEAFHNGNGQLDNSTVTLDALGFFRSESSASVDIYIDDVMWKRFGGDR